MSKAPKAGRSRPESPQNAPKRVKPTAEARDGEISLSEAARHLAITLQSAGAWASRPGAPVRREGTRVHVRWPDFARWREQQLIAEATKKLRDQLAAKDPHGTPSDRMQRAHARKAEIETELLERTIVRVDVAAAVTEKLLTDLRAQLVPFAKRWAPEFMGAKSIPEMEQRVDRAMERTMQALSAPDLPTVPARSDARTAA